MIVLAIWIKFFLSWKKEIDSTFHSSDLNPINNQDPDEGNVDKDETLKTISGEDKKEATTESSIKKTTKAVDTMISKNQPKSIVNLSWPKSDNFCDRKTSCLP